MRTLRAVRHMARVECVTVQVRASQSRGGFVKPVPVVEVGVGSDGEAVVAMEEEEEEEAYFEGMRRIMVDFCVSVDMMRD